MRYVQKENHHIGSDFIVMLSTYFSEELLEFIKGMQ